jgi:hypothetical protein
MFSRHAGSVAAHRLRQRSRRPDRHVVCSLAIFPPAAFLRFDKQIKLGSGTNYSVIKDFQYSKYSLKAEQEGAFFSSESAEKNRTGWVGLRVS